MPSTTDVVCEEHTSWFGSSVYFEFPGLTLLVTAVSNTAAFAVCLLTNVRVFLQTSHPVAYELRVYRLRQITRP